MSLKKIRNKIDSIDLELVKLINRRMQLALDSKSFKSSIIDKNREEEVLDNIESELTKLTSPLFMNNLYQLIFKESKKIQGVIE